jgi:membrane fusion protein (multidrug efflux system)
MMPEGLDRGRDAPASVPAPGIRGWTGGKQRFPQLRRHRTSGLLGLGLVGLVVAAGWGYMRLSHVTENDARVKADMITISSRVDGWVIARPVTDGQRIRLGEELVVIDQRESQLRLAELQARAESIQLQRKRVATQLRIVEATAPDAVTAAKAHRAAAEAGQRSAASRLDQAKRDFQRAEAMVDRIVSREVWDQRQTQLRQAEEAELSATAQLAAAEAALTDAQAKLGDVDVLRAELAGLEQDSAQVDAQVHAREVDLADRRIRSPIDGIVDEKFVQPGEYVIPGQRLLIIHDPKGVWISADIKETKLTDLKPGQPVEIGVDAYPDRRFIGRIERIGNAATSEFALLPSPNPSGNFTKITQRVPVRIAVEQPADNPLRPGMMVEVDIDTGHR